MPVTIGNFNKHQLFYITRYGCLCNGNPFFLQCLCQLFLCFYNPVVLNDVVIGKNQIGKMIRLNLWINDNFAQQYPCDGLIISTPTGSTGYAFSCGGPILHSAAQEMIVVPICPHTLAKFSSVLSKGDRVKITLSDREELLHISLDGNGDYDLKKGEALVVQGVHKKIRFVRFNDQDFWEILSDKLVKKI